MDAPIPDRFRAKCAFGCGHDVNTNADGVYQFISGWVKNRSDGGAHGISLPKRENRWACGQCIDRAIRGFINQNDLFSSGVK